MMNHHELKTDPEVFQMTWDGKKGYEIRINDRDYQSGDSVILKETRLNGAAMRDGAPLEYTGRVIEAVINSVIKDYGMHENWVILNLGYQKCLQGDQVTSESRWTLTDHLRQKGELNSQQAARIADLDSKLDQAIDLLDIHQRSALLMEWSQLEAKDIPTTILNN